VEAAAATRFYELYAREQLRLAADRVGDRVITLMLLRRSGILLFHDVHPRALAALPQIAATAARAGVSFLDCRKR
jgi:hypothetical protein